MPFAPAVEPRAFPQACSQTAGLATLKHTCPSVSPFEAAYRPPGSRLGLPGLPPEQPLRTRANLPSPRLLMGRSRLAPKAATRGCAFRGLMRSEHPLCRHVPAEQWQQPGRSGGRHLPGVMAVPTAPPGPRSHPQRPGIAVRPPRAQPGSRSPPCLWTKRHRKGVCQAQAAPGTRRSHSVNTPCQAETGMRTARAVLTHKSPSASASPRPVRASWRVALVHKFRSPFCSQRSKRRRRMLGLR